MFISMALLKGVAPTQINRNQVINLNQVVTLFDLSADGSIQKPWQLLITAKSFLFRLNSVQLF